VQFPAAQRGCGDAQRVGGGPGGVSGIGRAGGRGRPDVGGGFGGGTGSVLPDRVPLLRRELPALRCAGWLPAGAEPRQGQVSGELPAAEPHRAGRLLGRRVAGDIALIGFDNWEPMVLGSEPPLTSIDMCLEDVGRTAAQHLLAAINDAPTHGVHMVPCRLVVRESTGQPGERPRSADQSSV